ncbi:hypothetical protein GCM10007049_26340 [Echinicola pacifica]|uniref:GDSL-like Lipase/Acylhydrolase n=1 Tax=Echinicola pacifica TaxID=346377 RepID=A0A918Q2P9_9BACT|nr:SGNH/GDSL hydrolase family protein [Echinicola pacifica]GGZ31749.1 hypothetical protein GCM10007049_26340 [Echinicola pacifica]
MTINYKTIYLTAVAALAFSCQYEFPAVPDNEPSPGNADFSKMINVGNSLTAGLMDGALYNRSQQNSFAIILAAQLEAVGGGSYNVPSINSENGYFAMGPNGPLGRLTLVTNSQTGAIGPQPIGAGDLPSAYTGDKASLNNFGVPGITIGQALTPLTGGPASTSNAAYNPLYARFASAPGQSTIIGDAAMALADGGSFFTFWLGANDVLGYAITGAANPTILTSDSDFQERLTLALNTLLSANESANGVVMNIPGIETLPYFNLVPYNAIPLTQAEANQLNQGYTAYNAGLGQALLAGFISEEEKNYRTIEFIAGNNSFVIEDESLTNLTALGLPSIRQSKKTDKTTLPLSQALGQPSADYPNGQRGLSFPVEDSYILIPDEQVQVNTKISTFNGYIAAAVSAHQDRLILVDIAAFMQEVAAGTIKSNGVSLNASIVPPNGGISTDGIHPNGRAHAFITNLVIDGINAKWQANILKINPNAYIGNDLPVVR